MQTRLMQIILYDLQIHSNRRQKRELYGSGDVNDKNNIR